VSRLEILDARKRYGGTVALNGVSLTLEEGTFFGLLGPSGSGKTTLLRAIAGFVTLDSGAILLDGTEISKMPVHKRDIGMVFQNYALFPHLSVFENIAFGLTVRNLDSAAIKQRVGEILDLVQLSGLDLRKPAALSGGQQQRVALARALVTRPRLLLLDEPLSALDKNLRQEMQVELRRIQREVGITTVFVTHDQEEALTLSDRIAILRGGDIVQSGQPDAVYEHPHSRFCAAFLGDANFLEGRVVSADRGVKVALALGGEARLETIGEGLASDGVVIALRPEKIVIAPQQAAPLQENTLDGILETAIFSGSSTTYHVRVAGQILKVFRQNIATADHGNPIKPGTPVRLSWAAAHNILVKPD